MQIPQKSLYLQSQYGNGALAERLGTGLQNLLQRFDSARHLKNASQIAERHFTFSDSPESIWGSMIYLTLLDLIIKLFHLDAVHVNEPIIQLL